MKFYQLEVGQTFWLNGFAYVKSSADGARAYGEQKEQRVAPHTNVEVRKT